MMRRLARRGAQATLGEESHLTLRCASGAEQPPQYFYLYFSARWYRCVSTSHVLRNRSLRPTSVPVLYYTPPSARRGRVASPMTLSLRLMIRSGHVSTALRHAHVRHDCVFVCVHVCTHHERPQQWSMRGSSPHAPLAL